MKLPFLFLLTLSYLLGIVVASQFKISFLLLILPIIVSLVVSVLLYKKPLLSFSLLLLAFFTLGMLMTSLVNLHLQRSLLAKWIGKGRVTVTGTVGSEPKEKRGYSSFNLKVHTLEKDKQKWRVSERVKVVLKDYDKSPNLFVGTKLTISGLLTLPSPSGSSYQKYLYHQKIRVVLRADTLKLESSKKSGIFSKLIELSRQSIKKDSRRLIKGDEAGLMIGILLGDTSGISAKLQDNFRITGLTHILAVSGLNVGMLLVVILGLLRLLRCRPLLQVLLAALFIAFYSFLTRNEPSVMRASLMAVIGLCGWLMGRRKDLLSALSGAALLLLVYNPFLLYSVSFQLSFAATLAIILVYPILELRLSEIRIPAWLRRAASVSIAAQLGVIPILAYYFNQASLVSLLANLLVVPVTAPVLALGMGSWALSFISSQLSQLGYLLSFPLLKYMVETTKLLAKIPKAAVDLPSPSAAVIIIYYLVLGVTLYGLSLRKRSWDRRVLLFLLLWFTVFVWSQVLYGQPPASFEVTFLDVGQGDAALFRTPQGANILIDGGESPTVLYKALLKRKVKRIDLLILSHPHADHVGALIEVIKRTRVGLVLDSGQTHTSPSYREFLEIAREREIPYKIVRRKTMFEIGENVQVKILHPPQRFITGTVSDLNNNSVVAKVSYKDVSFLFPGDLELEGQREILSCSEDLESDVLKIPHHGSAGGVSPPFLKAVKPRIAVISVGKNNPFGHPAKITLKRLKSLGIRIYRTDEKGDVTIVSDGKELGVK